MTGVAAICAFNGAHPAQAAHWELSVESTGTAHSETNGNVGNPSVDVFGQGTNRRDPYVDLSPKITSAVSADHTRMKFTAQPATSQIDMDCIVVMTWTKDYWESELPAPPDVASFLVTVGGYVSNYFNDGPLVHSELDIGGLIKPASIAHIHPENGITLSDGQHQEKDDIFVRVNDESDELRMGYRSILIQKSTEGQTTVRWTAPHLKALVRSEQGQVPNNNPQRSGLAKLSFAAKNDDRSVSISSSNIDSSYRRTLDASQPLAKYRDQVLPDSNPNGSTIGESAAGLLHERAADGSMTADSVVQWQNGSWKAIGGFYANGPGDWNNPTYDWSVAGDGTQAFGYTVPEQQNSQSMSLGLNMGTDTDSFPKSSTVTVEVTDGQDGAVGKNTYDVKWHFPYEKEIDRVDGPRMKELFWLSKGFMNGNTSLETDTSPAQSFDALAMIDDVLVLAGSVGAPTEPISEIVSIYKALTNISKWTEEAPLVEVTATGHPNDDSAFSAAVSHWPENIENMDVATRDALMQSQNYYSFSDYDVYVGRVRYHHEKSLLADKYDIHGFHSSNHVLRHDVTERIEFQNYYQKRNTSPTNPPVKGDTEVPPSYNLS